MPYEESRRTRRRSLRRRWNRAERQIAIVVVAAGLVAAGALVILARGSPPAAPYAPSAPPLAPSSGSPREGTLAPQSQLTPVRLEAPTVGINLGVVEGDGVHVPLNLAAHYPGTAEPGTVGNAVYYAHAQPGMFLGLYSLHFGDPIRVVRLDGTQLTFHVAGFRKVPFNDRAVLSSTPYGELTLLTCTSYDPYTPRFIVIAT